MRNNSPSNGSKPRYPVWRRILFAACITSGIWIGAGAPAQNEWHVTEAPVRFNVAIESQPSDPRAGIIAILPDGGLLPGPHPVATVVDRGGNTLKSETVWHNPDEGFAVVFERPGVGLAAWIYVRGADRAPEREPSSSFKPSLMVYVQTVPPGNADLRAAQRLADNAPPGRHARFGLVHEIRSRNNPLWREDRHFVSYYSGYLKSPRPGATWIATVSQDGSRVRIDGRTVATWPAGKPREDGQRGQVGGTVDLGDDIHHVEYLHHQSTGSLEMLLAWRLPGQSSRQLPDEMRRGSYVHSGRARLAGAQSREGTPLPLISAERLNHLWLFERPVFLIRCSTRMARGNPEDSVYTWRIGNSPEIRDNDFLWLLEGTDEVEIRLSASSEKGRASATLPFYLREHTQSASLDNPDHREAYRRAFLNMCRAMPPGESPARAWSGDMWQTLLEVLEPYRGSQLLIELFDRAYDDIVNMPAEARHRLQDYFFEIIRYTDKPAAPDWLRKFQMDAEDRDRRLHWQLTHLDFLLYDMGATNEARQIVRQLQRASGDPEVSIRADIREGDIERLAGNFEQATRIYSRAQDRYAALRRSRQTRQTLDASGTTLRGADAIREARERRRSATLRQAHRARVEDWRIMAVRASMHAETIRELIRTGHLFKARDAIAQWEVEFPLHKIAEDLLIIEAEYFMTIGNYPRAVLLLSNYRDAVGMTNFLPMAMQMELECLLQMEKDQEIRELIKEIQRRLPNHPVADTAARVLETL